jgi:hypothetical protein
MILSAITYWKTENYSFFAFLKKSFVELFTSVYY